MARPAPAYATARDVVLAIFCLIVLVVAFCAAAAFGWVYLGPPA